LSLRTGKIGLPGAAVECDYVGVVAQQGAAGDVCGRGVQVQGGEDAGLRGDVEDAAGGIKGEDVGLVADGEVAGWLQSDRVSSTSWALPSQATYARLSLSRLDGPTLPSWMAPRLCSVWMVVYWSVNSPAE